MSIDYKKLARGYSFAVLGGDPEHFILDEGGTSVGAHTFGLPKNKAKVMVVGTYGDTYFPGYRHRDGWAVEFNPTPSSCRALLYSAYRNLVKSMSLLGKHELWALSTVEVPPSWAEDAPLDVRRAGCNPALNAYTREIELPAVDYDTYPLRHGGGHMHISAPSFHKQVWKNGPRIPLSVTDYFSWYENIEDVCQIVRLWDRYVGLLDTYLFGSPEQAARRKVYGKAGEFRKQKHDGYYAALEYRTPGPEFWLSPALVGLYFGLLRLVYENWPVFVERHAAESTKTVIQVRKAINAGTARDDLLDLIPEAPSLYHSRTALRTIKKHAAYLSRSLTQASKLWPRDSHTGWSELVVELLGVKAIGRHDPRIIYANDIILDPNN